MPGRKQERCSARREAFSLPAPSGRRPDEVPMHRYIPSTLSPAPACPTRQDREVRLLLEQLQQLAVQRNQLLTDLLVALNGLTAAVLASLRQGERS